MVCTYDVLSQELQPIINVMQKSHNKMSKQLQKRGLICVNLQQETKWVGEIRRIKTMPSQWSEFTSYLSRLPSFCMSEAFDGI